MDTKKQEEYHFVKEHIKKIPPDRKKRRMSLGWTILLAAVFGVVAALVFCAVKPAIERLFQSKNEQVVLSSDETKEADTADEPVYITETQQMDLNDYQILQNKLYAVGREANKSVVSVKGIGQTTDWFDTEHVMENQGSGIILADTNGRYLIATERKLIAEAKKYEFASVCVNPTWVKTAADLLKDSSIKVCTVIGFPLGATTSSVKAFETRDAISMV